MPAMDIITLVPVYAIIAAPCIWVWLWVNPVQFLPPQKSNCGCACVL